ncbi:hypothetical protein PSCICL_39690 [Pseudomonas cichorii]|nr:hypothetical protein PSCICL_39690 [Pseudomonas cichorii]
MLATFDKQKHKNSIDKYTQFHNTSLPKKTFQPSKIIDANHVTTTQHPTIYKASPSNRSFQLMARHR